MRGKLLWRDGIASKAINFQGVSRDIDEKSVPFFIDYSRLKYSSNPKGINDM